MLTIRNESLHCVKDGIMTLILRPCVPALIRFCLLSLSKSLSHAQYCPLKLPLSSDHTSDPFSTYMTKALLQQASNRLAYSSSRTQEKKQEESQTLGLVFYATFCPLSSSLFNTVSNAQIHCLALITSASFSRNPRNDRRLSHSRKQGVAAGHISIIICVQACNFYLS